MNPTQHGNQTISTGSGLTAHRQRWTHGSFLWCVLCRGPSPEPAVLKSQEPGTLGLVEGGGLPLNASTTR